MRGYSVCENKSVKINYKEVLNSNFHIQSETAQPLVSNLCGIVISMDISAHHNPYDSRDVCRDPGLLTSMSEPVRVDGCDAERLSYGGRGTRWY